MGWVFTTMTKSQKHPARGERTADRFGRSTTRCANCGRELRSHPERREGACSDLECRGPHLQRKKEQRVRAEATTILEQTFDLCQEGTLSLLTLVVPCETAPAVKSPDKQRQTLANHLRAAMRSAAGLIEDEDQRVAIRQEFADRSNESPTPLPIHNACATCEGRCCGQGRNHAFLGNRFIAFRLLSEPESDPEAMIDDYLSRIPDQHIEDSCLYHTSSGCALPRRLRSSTCNEFLCSALTECMNVITDSPSGPSAVAAHDGYRVRRVAVMNDQGERRAATIN